MAVVVVVGWYLSLSNVNDPDSDDDDRCRRRHGAIRMEVSSSSAGRGDQDSGAVVDSVFGWKREWRAIYSWVPPLLSWHVVRVSWVPRPSGSSSRRSDDDD